MSALPWYFLHRILHASGTFISISYMDDVSTSPESVPPRFSGAVLRFFGRHTGRS